MAKNDLPPSFRLPSSRHLKPLQQGDMDGLCGIYSLINAFMLVRYEIEPIRWPETIGLFSFALFRVAERENLRQTFITGVPWSTLTNTGKKLAVVGSSQSSFLSLSIVKRGGIDRIDVLKKAILAGTPVIASIHRDEHYSVIVGWTPTRALLFDSSGNQWTPLRSIHKSLCMTISAAPAPG